MKISEVVKATGHVLTKVGVDVLKVLQWPFVHTAMLAKVLDRTYVTAQDAIKDEPQVRELILGLVQNFEKLGPDTLAALASKGTDIGADIRTVEDVRAAFQYFTGTFLPQVEAIYKGLETDVEAAKSAGAPSPAPQPIVEPPVPVTA